jgi:hypothetical protein
VQSYDELFDAFNFHLQATSALSKFVKDSPENAEIAIAEALQNQKLLEELRQGNKNVRRT